MNNAQRAPGVYSQLGLFSQLLTRRKVLLNTELKRRLLGLTAVVLATTLPYVSRLGLYSDDWGDQKALHFCPDQSITGLVHCLDLGYRPLQALQRATLYSLFGERLSGYYLYNALLFVCLVLLLYKVLSEFAALRPVALPVALVYALLPNYSTDRFWIATFQANLSVALFLGGALCTVRAFPSTRQGRPLYAAGALVLLLLSPLAYEITVPFFILIPILLWNRLTRERRMFVTVCVALLSTATIGWKLLKQNRVHFHGAFLQHPSEIVTHFLRQMFDSTCGRYGLGLPYTTWQIAVGHGTWIQFASSLLIGLCVFACLYRVETWPERRTWVVLSFAGLALFTLAFSPFAANVTQTLITPGVANRIASCMAIGTALFIVGTIGLLSGCWNSQRVRQRLFSFFIGAICASGCLVLTVIASCWTAAAAKQQEVLSTLANVFQKPQPDTTILLDGFCPYLGPGIVFEGYWDAEGALDLLYSDQSLRGDVITPNLQAHADGIHTFFYGQDKTYLYGRKLIIYDVHRRLQLSVTDWATANDYLNSRTFTCPAGVEGYGSPFP